MKAENAFIAGVHKYLPPSLYRMKNHNPYTAGVADCWYSGRRDLWVEYKFIVLPARSSTVIKPELSALQLDWCCNRRREGRNVCVIVGCKEGGVVIAADNPALWAGIACRDFTALLQTRRDLAHFITKEVT